MLTSPGRCRLKELCFLHQEPMQLQPEQQAANRKLLEELQDPLIHTWQLNAADGLMDARWLQMCLRWGLSPEARDLQGRTMLHKACMVRRWPAELL